MATMDFNALRAQTFASGADEEAVTVNTRALIDKVLARYSGEWTTLRELIQNAADATATKVSIKFETMPSTTIPLPQDATDSDLLKHTIQHHTVKRLVVTNNGTPFNENDWTRLKRIAEGNPDETKIGAFGVGFYSVFADCEEPFISSGREAMAFFWKKNSLFTRRLKLPEEKGNLDTNFVLDYRDTTSAVPSLLSLCQFLANSLTFVGIEQVELLVDQWKILVLDKRTSPSQSVNIVKDIQTKTEENLMTVKAVSKELAQINASWMPIVAVQRAQPSTTRNAVQEEAPSLRKFFSRFAQTAIKEEPEKQSKPTTLLHTDFTKNVHASIFLNVHTASIETSTSQKFKDELERATKKPPPRTTRLSVLTAPFVEDDSLAATATAGDIFGTVLPSRSGRIFIGFPTHQTTGLNAHISAPSVIPTVERESIDLNAKYVRTWNTEMLRAAGIVCRIVWTSEMADLRSRIKRSVEGSTKIRPQHVEPFLPEGIKQAQNFTFRESTPSPKTGELLEDAFWRCGKKPSIDVLSSRGVLPTFDVRVAPKDLSFLEGVPVLPEKLVDQAKGFVDKLVEFGLVTEVTVPDIKNALETNALSTKQLGEFLDWIIKQATRQQLEPGTIRSLLTVAVANEELEGEQNGKLLILGGVEYFHNPSRIPANMPVPDAVMPLKYTNSYSKHELESIGWEEYQIVPWMRWLLAESKSRGTLNADQDLTSSVTFSTQIWPLLSKQWDTMSQSSKQSLVDLLAPHTVMPTKLGMKKPGDAYFPNVKLFDDLPTITGVGNVKDKVLTAFGVRKTVELGVVFDRLLRSKNDSTTATPGRHLALIEYLASVRDDIPTADMQRLRQTPFAPKEDRSSENRESDQYYRINELFEPRAQLRDLGLPMLAWNGLYKSNSPQGRLLSSLGLRTAPTVEELVEIMARASRTKDSSLRDRAISFFVSSYHSNGYNNFDFSKVQTPFLPLENKPDELSVPTKCFVDKGATLFGFDVLRQDLWPHATMFGVRRHPPIEVCVALLSRKRFATPVEARELFEYFGGRLMEINNTVIPKLENLAFVPIFTKSGEKHIAKSYLSPRNVFLGDGETFGDIFSYVNFGQEANSFLLKCGSKLEPTRLEIAQILVREPARISSSFKDPEKYLALLRSIAEGMNTFKKNKDLLREMKKAPFLLASKYISTSRAADEKSDPRDFDDDDDSRAITQYQLCSAEDAIIIDDFTNYSLFKTDILAAPQEEALEDFYYSLGSPMLSSLVEEAAKHGPKAVDQRPAEKLQKLIFERVALFLHDQAPDAIRHNFQWFEKNLSVAIVSSITLRRSLKGRNLTHSEKRTAVITSSIDKKFTLYSVGAQPDFYQVSQALIHLLLLRPKVHSSITLEMLLKSDLLELRHRGFNVSRILRQKAAEARLLESKRQQELEEQQKQIEEQQAAWNSSQKALAERPKAQRETSMAGAFPDSPDHRAPEDNSGYLTPQPDVPRDPMQSAQQMLSNFTRNLGFGNRQQRGNQALQQGSQLQQRPQTPDMPPSYNQASSSGPNTGAVTSPHAMQQNLLSAIRKTRAHNSSDVFSRGETTTVTEAHSYCDEKPSHDLSFVATLSHSIQFFVASKSVQDMSSFLQVHALGLQAFTDLLNAVAQIFNLNTRTINVFYDRGGKTIAFNSNGSIFCNYLYFQQLHEQAILQRKDGAIDDAIPYWFMVMCHELAHNLVADHSSNHSYYVEGFAAQYFGKCARTCMELNRRSQAPAIEA